MLQRKSCLRSVEILGGRGVIKDPLGTEIPKGWGVQTKKTFRGRGMDIFWNHTLSKTEDNNKDYIFN